MRSLSASYEQKNQASRRGFSQLAQAESARNVQNAQIKDARKQQRFNGAISGATAGAQIGGGYGALIGGALGLLAG